MLILVHLAWRAIEHVQSSGKLVVWIGRSCWPYPRALVRSGNGALMGERELLNCSLLIDVADDASRLWAIDLTLRSQAVAMVIADGTRLDMAATRRLQLAAEAGGAIALLARAPSETSELSAATTRWLVRPQINFQSFNPGWTVQLLRCKGLRPASEQTTAQRCWVVQAHGAQSIVNLSADVVDRPGSKTPQPAVQPIPVAARRSA